MKLDLAFHSVVPTAMRRNAVGGTSRSVPRELPKFFACAPAAGRVCLSTIDEIGYPAVHGLVPVIKASVLYVGDEGRNVVVASVQAQLEALNPAALLCSAGDILSLARLGGSRETLALDDKYGLIDGVWFCFERHPLDGGSGQIRLPAADLPLFAVETNHGELIACVRIEELAELRVQPILRILRRSIWVVPPSR